MYKCDLNAHLRMTCLLKVAEAPVLYIADPGEKTEKQSFNLGGTLTILEIKLRMAFVQHEALTECVSLQHLGRAPLTAEPLQHSTDAIPAYIATKKRKSPTWEFTHISNHHILRSK